ncbi:MAG: Uracil-DNA glycosylase [Pelagibacterales bacterium]|nr:Uracil-DNA glycosylase [Pelagibacterales bacterium]
MKKNLNQKLINLIEYYNLVNANFLLSNTPLNRMSESKLYNFSGTKSEKLSKLKKKIYLIKNCDLKKNAKQLVFANGNINPKIMIVGEGQEQTKI